MSQTSHDQSNLSKRVAKLERALFWHKVGLIILMVFALGLIIPSLGKLIGLLMLIGLIAGGVIAFISLIIYLLNRYYPSSESKR